MTTITEPLSESFKLFGRDKRYDLHPELLDLHVPRMLEAHRIVDSYMKPTPLLEGGVLAVRNFLGSEIAGEVWKQGIQSYIKDGRRHSTTVVNLEGTPAFAAAGFILKIVRQLFPESLAGEIKHLFRRQTYIQHLLNAPGDGDDQKNFHTDTFFPNVKFWYFPKEVTEGAFWYVPHSVKLTDKLIDWHKARVKDLKAGKDEVWRGPSHKQGSFRISDEEIAGLGLKGVPVCVEADTLVIANVFGFHRRGEVSKPTNRVSIHGNLRLRNPFEWYERNSPA